MTKRGFYDLITLVFIVVSVVVMFLFVRGEGQLSLNTMTSFSFLGGILFLVAFLYSISIIVLNFTLEDTITNKIFTVIGSLLFPGILPLIVYATHLRKKLKEAEQPTLQPLTV